MVGGTLTGCARSGDHPPASAGAPPAAATDAAAPATEPAVTRATLTVADLDLYARLMHDRIDSAKNAAARISHATTRQDTLQGIAGLAMGGADSVLAARAGVSVAHVRGVDKVVAGLLGDLQSSDRVGAVGGQVDTSQMSPDDRAQVRQLLAQGRHTADSSHAAAIAGMAPDVVAAFTQRRAALDSLLPALMLAGTPGHP
jgi:hypothetical protein